MHSFRKSLLTLVGLLILVAASAALLPLVGRGQGGDKNPLRRDPRKSFYLTTQATYNGAQAPTACAEGYHMASLWEIFDTSNLRYDTQLGFTQADSGFGPPHTVDGWVRTGGPASSGFMAGEPRPGVANCQAYTSSSSADFGTRLHLSEFWESTGLTIVSPWVASVRPCDLTINGRVWCVQD